jgi:hypothetical protein
MSRIRTEKFSHPCPFPECEDEVILEYEVGKGREDFILWMEYDEIKCEKGHPVTQEWADAQWTRDSERMADRARDAWENAYDAHVDYLIDVARRK